MYDKIHDINLTVKFFGQFAGSGEEREVKISADGNIKAVSQRIDELVVERMGKKIPYVLLINGVNHALHAKTNLQSQSLKTGDVLTVVPIVIGG